MVCVHCGAVDGQEHMVRCPQYEAPLTECNCAFELIGEHVVTCPVFEPPLTVGEIRALRRLLRLKPLIGFEVGSDREA